MNYNAIIKEIKILTATTKLFKIVFENGNKLDYHAGQFVMLGLPEDKNNLDGKWIRRAYSITSSPKQDEVEFYIVLVKDGELTTRLFDLKAGDKIYMSERAAGIMEFKNINDTDNIIFLSTGTGIAPFISILRNNKNEILNGKRKVVFAQGVRHSSELAFEYELLGLEESNKFFKYFPVVSRAEEEGIEWTGTKGHIQTLVTDGSIEKFFEMPIDPKNTNVFLCGTPKMVDECVNLFTDMGFTKHTLKEQGNLFFDKH